MLFPIADSRQVVEIAKRILTKEKIDRQLAGQTSSTPFMSVTDGLNKRVTFNTTDDLEQKIDRLTVLLGKLVIEDEGQPKPFKPQICQSNRGRNQNRGNYQGRFRNNNAYRGHPTYNLNFRGRTRGNFKIEAAMDTICEVIKDTKITTIIIERMGTEVRVTIEIEVGN